MFAASGCEGGTGSVFSDRPVRLRAPSNSNKCSTIIPDKVPNGFGHRVRIWTRSSLSEWFISMYVRFLWTGQRIETFYTLLVKDVLSSGDVDVVDTKDNRQGRIL